MSPREKWWIAFISLVVFAFPIICLIFYFIPYILYLVFVLAVSCVACFYYTSDSAFQARLGPHPRTSLPIPPVFRRWLPGGTANGVPAPGRVPRDRSNKGNQRDSVLSGGGGRLESPGDFHKYADSLSDSVLFSPRDILMGSYIGKPESHLAAGRAGGGAAGASRELRERLCRPNHAVHTPNRRLSFGETFGAVSRFTITPQRHYPLQQAGSPSLGLLPPARWDGSWKKNILTPRNSPVVHSPVTVKIARPDHVRSPVFEPLNSSLTSPSAGLGAAADPCSRETVLSVLKESRKREVDRDEDKAYSHAQKSKRRRNDSGGSSHSAFEPLLANGAPSQLVPKPGSLKRGLNASVMEESLMKRTRTSSTSSLGGALGPCGVLGSARNPIRSSYSSTQGYSKRKMTSSLNFSPLSSPGSSRSQTPEKAVKKPREEDVESTSPVLSPRVDKATVDNAPSTGKLTPNPDAPAPTVAPDSGGSEGKRKRKIQLVSSRRADHISLPPPPELGFKVTVKDLDMERAAALSRIKKVLEEPEPEKPAPAPTVPTFLAPSSSTVVPSTTSLLLGSGTSQPSTTAPVLAPTPAPPLSLSTSETSLTGTISATPSVVVPSAAPVTSTASSLLESLKMMKSSPAPGQAVVSSTAPVPLVVLSSSPAQAAEVKSEPSVMAAQPAVRAPPPAQPPSTLATSAFAQVLVQPLKPPSTAPLPASTIPFGLRAPASAPSPSVTSTATTGPVASSNATASAFKPIFTPVATTATSSAPNTPASATSGFKPIFGSATASPSFGQPASSAPSLAPVVTTAPSSSSGSTLFSSLSSSTTVSAQGKPLFSNWSAAPAPSTATTSATISGSAFQFGTMPTATATLPVTTTTSSFQFGSTATTATAPQVPTQQAAAQGVFAFSQLGKQTATTGSVGGFGVTSTSATTVATVPAASQSIFTFGKSTFERTPQQTGTAAPAPVKPFAFGASATGPFGFGMMVSTAAPTFGTPSQPAFGSGTANFAFATTSTPSTTPAFGSVTQTPAPVPTFTFGASSAAPPSAPAQQNAGGFNFGAAVQGAPFGTPAPANSTTQTSGFAFGASNTQDSKPAFGYSFGNAGLNFSSGTSTPAFGQSPAAGAMPFGSPGTQTAGFGALASPFGTPPSFSIGSCSKPTGARQRLQARRQHQRKK